MTPPPGPAAAPLGAAHFRSAGAHTGGRFCSPITWRRSKGQPTAPNLSFGATVLHGPGSVNVG